MPKTWYLCDPEKNTACEKTYCAYNPAEKWRMCMLTSDAKCAHKCLDGTPCPAPDWIHKRRSEEIAQHICCTLERIKQAILGPRNAARH